MPREYKTPAKIREQNHTYYHSKVKNQEGCFFIYAIVCDCCDQMYIGQTKVSLKKRFSDHKAAAKTKTYKLYEHMNEKDNYDGFKIVELKKTKCTKKEAEALEGDEIKAKLKEGKKLFNLNKVSTRECSHSKNKYQCKECNNHHCETCDRKFSSKTALANHKNTRKHRQTEASKTASAEETPEGEEPSEEPSEETPESEEPAEESSA